MMRAATHTRALDVNRGPIAHQNTTTQRMFALLKYDAVDTD